ncbi:helicase RepA family protein, partial [Escherichia coli]
MRNAPNVKLLPKDPFTEAIIFAGSDAWSHAKGWEEGMGKQVAGDTTPPVYLGPR